MTDRRAETKALLAVLNAGSIAVGAQRPGADAFGQGLRAMALAGLGLARLAEFHVADDLAAGRLTRF